MVKKVLVSNDKTINSPAVIGDSGYDIVAASDPVIVGLKVEGDKELYHSIDYIEYDTDLIIEPPSGCHTYVFPRSSVSKTNLILANSVGLIDSGYRGSIKLRFKYLIQPVDMSFMHGAIPVVGINKNKIYKKGDKIGQLVFSEKVIPQIEVVSSFEETQRNQGGFGSTGL